MPTRQQRTIPISYDTETTGLKRHLGHRMFAFSTCDWDGEVEVLREDRDASYRPRVENIWVPGSPYGPAMQNAKFDLGMTQDLLGRRLRDEGHVIHETMALDHIACNNRPTHKLGDVAWALFGFPKKADEATAPYLNADMGLLACPAHVLDPYQQDDAVRTMLILKHYLPKLRDHPRWQECYDMERALIWTTMDLEERGIMISEPRARELQAWCREESTVALAEYRAITGARGTPMSASLGRVLQGMGFKISKRTKTDRISTDKGVLMDLREKTGHKVFDAILKYRAYSRGDSTIEGYVNLAVDDVLHPSIFPYAADTSRESCSEPNLQNVEKETTLRNPYPIPARRVFRPKPGFVNFHVDYASIEARILVHFSGDPEALEIFKAGKDFMAATAECWYGERFRLATGKGRKSLRDAGKNATYAKGYGARLKKIAATLGVSYPDVVAGDRRFTERFPKYSAMSKRFISTVRENGAVETIFGRRLAVPRNKPYAGSNYVVQGSAAGILKRAQIRVDDYLRRETGGEAGIILPIHDELVIEWPRARVGEAREHLRRIRDLMVDFPQCSVPLEVDVEVSTRDWATTSGYDLEAA